MNKCLRFLKVKLLGYKPLQSTFINTKLRIITIQPDVRLSFNETFQHLKKEVDDRYRKDRELTLEVS